MKKIGIIHTTPATVKSLGELIAKKIPEVRVFNILDDSILGDMCGQHRVDFVRERWLSYAATLEELGVDAVLSACSTVGAFAWEANQMLSIPVYRIDEAMAGEAVNRGSRISVLATLSSTLIPTVKLVEQKAVEAGKQVETETVLVEGAYEALMNGEREIHDRKIADAVKKRLDKADVLVLAQASMASAVEELEGAGEKVLTSPVLGIDKLKKDLEKKK